MKSVTTTFQEEFKKHRVVSKINNRFSCMPLDQSHEEENAKVKGKGGVIGLTENPIALQRRLICVPELANFARRQHLQLCKGLLLRLRWSKRVESLVDVIDAFGNPFEDDCPELIVLNSRDEDDCPELLVLNSRDEDDCPELLVLNSRDCADDSVIVTVRPIEVLGKSQ